MCFFDGWWCFFFASGFFVHLLVSRAPPVDFDGVHPCGVGPPPVDVDGLRRQMVKTFGHVVALHVSSSSSTLNLSLFFFAKNVSKCRFIVPVLDCLCCCFVVVVRFLFEHLHPRHRIPCLPSCCRGPWRTGARGSLHKRRRSSV